MKYSFVGDHFQYLGGAAVIAGVVAPTARFAASLRPAARRAALAGGALPVALLVALGALTWKHARVFRDEETLWRDAAAKNPASAVAHLNVGKALFARNDLDGALERYRAALALAPGDADNYYALGVVLGRQGRAEEALRHYQRALQIAPGYGFVYNNIGALMEDWGNLAEAERCYATATRLVPPSAAFASKPFENLGRLLARRGQLDEAATAYARAAQLDPGNDELRAKLRELAGTARGR
jgi:tetratricopeptide (TPR) repeat protein